MMSEHHLPLAGRRVVVTRARDQAQELVACLRAAGADPIAVPTIAIAAPADCDSLDAALRGWAGFDGCVFTSANAVRAVRERADALGVELAPPGWTCAVGPATAAAARQIGIRTNLLVPVRADSEAVIAALVARDLREHRVLWPRADIARDRIEVVLAAHGARVTSLVAYRNVPDLRSRPAAREHFPGADAVIFASPSAARNLAELLGHDHARRMRGAAIAVIGPRTRAAVELLGWRVGAEASQPGAAALVAAVNEALRHA